MKIADIQFPILKLFNQKVFKQILQMKANINNSDKSSKKGLNETELFRNRIQNMKSYDQFRREIMLLSKKYTSIEKKISEDSPPPILGFRCFTSVVNSYPKLVSDKKSISEFKTYLHMIYLLLDEKKELHIFSNQQEYQTLKNQIMFFYYQITLFSHYKTYIEKKKPKNQDQQTFFNKNIDVFYEGVKKQCNQLQRSDQFFKSNLMKLKFGIFHLNQMKRMNIVNGTYKKLTEIGMSFYNLFYEDYNGQFRKDSQLQKYHFKQKMQYFFRLFVDITNQTEASQKIHQIPLQLFQTFSRMEYDTSRINNEILVEMKSLKLLIKHFCEYLSNLFIYPDDFLNLSNIANTKIINQISNFLNSSQSNSFNDDKMLISHFKMKIQQIYAFKFFMSKDYITQTMFQADNDNIVQQQYLPLMLRQIISFLQLINIRQRIKQLKEDNQFEKLTLLKNQSNQLLNILLYYYQLERGNVFLQFQAKVLLIEVYQLLQISCKYYIRIYQDFRSVFYGLVSIKIHLQNLREYFFNSKNNELRHNHIEVTRDMVRVNDVLYKTKIQDSPPPQEEQEGMFQEHRTKRGRRQSVQLAVRDYSIPYNFTQIKFMKQFIMRIHLACKFNQLENGQIQSIMSMHNQHFKPKLNMKYVLKQESQHEEQSIFQQPIKLVLQNEDQAFLNSNRIAELFYKLYASSLDAQSLYSKVTSQLLKQILQDLYARAQQSVRSVIIDIQVKLLLGKYDQVINDMHKVIEINCIQQSLLNAAITIFSMVGQHNGKESMQIFLQKFDHFKRKILREFMNCCLLRNNQNMGVFKKRLNEGLIKKESKPWDHNQKKKLFNLHASLKNKMTVEWLLDNQQQAGNKDNFQISIDLSTLSDFQEKSKALQQLLKPYRKIEKKGICRLVNINKINKKIIITIDVNYVTVQQFLQQPSCSFYSELWTSLNDRHEHFKQLINDQRSVHYSYDKNAMAKLYEFSQFLIRKTVKNVIYLTRLRPAYEITSDDYFYQGNSGFCEKISINPFFKIINTLFVSSNQIADPEKFQRLQKLNYDYPFARNILNSQLLNLMILDPKQNFENPFEQNYKDYYLLCSKSFWLQYLYSLSHIIMQNNLSAKYFYQKLPLFQYPLQKISLIVNSFQQMRRGSDSKQGYQSDRKAKIKHKLIAKLRGLKYALHGEEYHIIEQDQVEHKDLRFIGIIHYQACSLFNNKAKYAITQQNIYFCWEYSDTNKKHQYEFVRRIAQEEKAKCHNFFHFMRAIRNTFSHKIFQVSDFQKLRVVSNDYPFIHTFLCSKIDELSAFSIEQIFKIRLDKCNNLLSILSNLGMDRSDDNFNDDTKLKNYFDILILQIETSLKHNSITSHTMQQHHSFQCPVPKCKGQQIYKTLIDPIKKIISGKMKFQLIIFEQVCMSILCCSRLSNKKIREIGIIQTITHLLHFFQYLLRNLANESLFTLIKARN